jgi:hypothetical protein
MYTLKKLIICAFLTQFAASCSASLPEQCKQLKAIQEASAEKKDPVPSRQFEIFSEQFSKKSKDIEKLSISDKDLKGIQQRFVTNYDSQAKRSLAQSAITKQLEIIESEPESMDKTRQFLDVMKQGNELQLGEQLIVLTKEQIAIVSDMEKICSSK